MPDANIGLDRYDDHPEHPLHGIDKRILQAARAAMDDVAEARDISPAMVVPVADMMVMALLPYLAKPGVRPSEPTAWCVICGWPWPMTRKGGPPKPEDTCEECGGQLTSVEDINSV